MIVLILVISKNALGTTTGVAIAATLVFSDGVRPLLYGRAGVRTVVSSPSF